MAEETQQQQAAPEAETKNYDTINSFAEQAKEGDYIPGDSTGPETGSDTDQDFTLSAQFIEDIALQTFAVLEQARGPHWQAKPMFVKAWAHSLNDCIEKYFPGFSVGPIATLVVTSSCVFGGPVLGEMALRSQPPQPEQETDSDGD